MSNVVQITVNGHEHNLGVKEYRRQRVITFRDVDLLHGRPDGTARKRFNDNKHRFVEREDYFVRKTDEALNDFGIVAPNGLILLTESGYLMLVKSFNDDIAWQVQRQLVNSYFRAKGVNQRSPDTILMRKLKLANSLAKGLPKPKQLELRRLAVMEAAEESGADYSAVLAVLAAPEPHEKDEPHDVDRDVDLFLCEVKKRDNYVEIGKYIHLEPYEDYRICQELNLNRALILKRLEERGLIKVSYDRSNGAYKKHYTAKSVFFNRRRCVQLVLQCFAANS